ncbi:MAG: NifB/NifX family molybdenum-iron cluster-binding protein [Candidatus Hodarchaeota archaeon]
MRIAIPTAGYGGLNDLVGQHFGRVPTYTIFDTNTNNVEVLPNKSLHMGGTGYPPEFLAQVGVELMICAGLGRRAINMFEQFGIEVFVGASATETAEAAIKAYQNGRLQMATDENACREHRYRRHEH